MTWQLCTYDDHGDEPDGKWTFEGTYESPEHVMTELALRTGHALVGEVDKNGSWRIIDLHGGYLVGCAREIIEQPTCALGGTPEGRLGPLRRWRGLTWIGWLNYLLLRWFLFRLAYVVEEDNTISAYYLQFYPTWRWR